MRISLQKYNFDLENIPGKQLFTADALSRAFHQSESSKAEPSITEEVEAYVNTIVTPLPVATTRLDEIKEETLKDPNLLKPANTIMKGWPDERKHWPPECTDYWNFREKLTVVDSIIFKGNRIVIPASLQKNMLQQMHKGHLGNEKCKRRVRDVIYWPRTNADIADMVQQCPTCISNHPKQIAEPMKAHEVPDIPCIK